MKAWILEKAENKELSNWKLILTSNFQIPNQNVTHNGAHVTGDLLDDT
jgi:hypothetical protein